MKKHIPSHIKIEGLRALISYEGQSVTCFRCNEQGHQIHECPHRRLPVSHQTNYDVNTWANVVKRVTNNGTFSLKQWHHERPYNLKCGDTSRHWPINTAARSRLTQNTNNTEITDRVFSPTSHCNWNSNTSWRHEQNQQHRHDGGRSKPGTTRITYHRSPVKKWANLFSTDLENEQENDKHGKKREQSKLTKDARRQRMLWQYHRDHKVPTNPDDKPQR